jgi:TonB family protein
VDVKVCAESGMLPGPNCERIVTKSFRPGRQPDAVCNVCKPKHVSTLADRSVPELLSGRRAPKYPASARDNGIEGSVTVEYTINTEGSVVGVRVTSSSGNSDLDRAAVDAIQSRKYKPAVQAGIPRDYRKRETFHFALD